jgi:nucleotide-binding universal stress UspA family protein
VAQCVSLARNGLLVLPAAKGNPLTQWLMGGPAERLIRLVRAPVLVVKRRAQDSYRRIFVAVDLLRASERLLAGGALLSRGRQIAVFHAVPPAEELLLREMEAPPHEVRAVRQARAKWARTRMEMLPRAAHENDGVAMPPGCLVPIVTFGRPADMILAGETAQDAELVIIGKRRRGLLADFFLGSVTRQVLARSEADVLVVPLGQEVVPTV